MSEALLPGGAVAGLPVRNGWRAFCQSLCELELRYLDDQCERFSSSVLDTAFGELTIRRVATQGGAHCAMRTKSLIASQRSNFMWICLVLNGRIQLKHAHQNAELQTGDFSIVDYGRHYSVSNTSSSVDTLWLGTPRALIKHFIEDVDELVGLRFDGSSASGQLTHRVISAAFANPQPMCGTQANRIVHSLFGMLGTAFDCDRLTHGSSKYRTSIRRRIKRYIEQHLDDEQLSVAGIARHQGISTRYLAKLFEGEDQTVSHWIWERRLQRCHIALSEAQAGKTVAEIAYANGFKNLSHFSRVFKARYGHSPSAIRKPAWTSGTG